MMSWDYPSIFLRKDKRTPIEAMKDEFLEPHEFGKYLLPRYAGWVRMRDYEGPSYGLVPWNSSNQKIEVWQKPDGELMAYDRSNGPLRICRRTRRAICP